MVGDSSYKPTYEKNEFGLGVPYGRIFNRASKALSPDAYFERRGQQICDKALKVFRDNPDLMRTQDKLPIAQGAFESWGNPHEGAAFKAFDDRLRKDGLYASVQETFYPNRSSDEGYGLYVLHIKRVLGPSPNS